MRDERMQIEPSALHHRDQALHAVLAAGAERRDDLDVGDAGAERVIRNRELAGVDAEARDRAAGANDAETVLERLLRPERFDGDVDAASGNALDLGDGVAFPVVEYDVDSHRARGEDPL